ncbi:MAG: hypothetical protein IJD10_02965 [Clostridia bacterium]|nr:hypothetical protein [Clostridia bacterium]
MNGTPTNMIVFRNSRKGYDKTDVHRYIEEMNIRFSAMEEQLKNQIRRTEQDLESARMALAAASAENEAMKAVCSENLDLKQEIEELKKQLEEALKPAEPNDAEGEVSLSYDEASKRLGDILMKANLDADRIVADAEAEAARQLTGAEKQADDIRLDAAVTARLMTDRVKRRLTELTGEYIESMEALSRASTEEYRKLCDELKAKLAGIGVDTSAVLRELKDS